MSWMKPPGVAMSGDITASDLDAESSTDGHVLTSDGAGNVAWEAVAAGAEVNDLSASVTWANVPNANITQASVTQHQAALSITESQISDLQAYLTSETSHADVVVDGDFVSNGILKRTGAGTYGIVTDNSTNWDTAFGWGNHTGLYEAADATILKDADIDVTVQSYDADTAKTDVAETVDNDWTFNPSGLGGLTDYDITIGNALNYGIARIGSMTIGRTSYNVGNLDLDGTLLVWNNAVPSTSNIEYAFADSSNNIRFALAKSGVGNATYNPRSMLIAGPAVLDDTIVTVGYWQGQGLFDNLACDTGTSGADLGVQNDLEVEGNIYADTITESTTGSGVTIASVPIDSGLVDGVDIGANYANWNSAYEWGDHSLGGYLTGNETITLSGDVTGSGATAITTTIAAGAVDVAMLANGTDGELITWSAAGAPATVAVGTSGHVLTSNGVGAAPTFQAAGGGGINEYMYPVWAEENAALGASNTYEWAFGNGANTPNDGGMTVYVPTGWTCEVVAMSLRVGGGTATVELVKNGTVQGTACRVVLSSGQSATDEMGTPLALANNDYINFRTTSSSGTSGPCVVTAWIKMTET